MDYDPFPSKKLSRRDILTLVAVFTVALVTLFGSFALIMARGITW